MKQKHKTALEELSEKESSYGRVFKVAGPCNFINLSNFNSGRRRINYRCQNV